jgi:hypothetical protein
MKLGEARELVRRLEERAERKIAEGGPDMAPRKNVDSDAIRADAEAGMSQAEIAVKYGVSQSTESHHVHALDAEPTAADRATRPT